MTTETREVVTILTIDARQSQDAAKAYNAALDQVVSSTEKAATSTDGLESSFSSSSQATRRATADLEALKRSFDPVYAATKDLEEAHRRLAQAAETVDAQFRAGTTSKEAALQTQNLLKAKTEELIVVQSGLTAGTVSAGAATSKVTEIMGAASEAHAHHSTIMGINVRQQKELMTITREVGVAMAAGVNPIDALAMQIGKLGIVAEHVGGVSMLAMAGAVVGILSPLALVIAATISYNKEVRETDRVLALVGGSAGVTRAQIEETATALGGNISRMIELQVAYAGTGKIGGAMLGGLAGATKDFATATGQDLDKARDQLAKLFTDPAKGAAQVNEQMHILSAADLERIDHLQKQGNLQAAQQILLDGITARTKDAAEKAGSLRTVWGAVSGAISDAYHWLGHMGEVTDEQKIAALQITVGNKFSTEFQKTNAANQIQAIRDRQSKDASDAAMAAQNAHSIDIGTQANSVYQNLLPEAQRQKVIDDMRLLIADFQQGRRSIDDYTTAMVALDAQYNAIKTPLERATEAFNVEIKTLSAEPALREIVRTKLQAEIDARTTAGDAAARQAIANDKVQTAWARTIVTANDNAEALRRQADGMIKVADASMKGTAAQHDAELQAQISEKTHDLVIDQAKAEGDAKAALTRIIQGVTQSIIDEDSARRRTALGQEIQQQEMQIETLQKTISLMGATVAVRDQEIARLAAVQYLRKNNLDLLDKEGEKYVANAVQIAHLNDEYQRLQAAQSELENFGNSAFSAILQASAAAGGGVVSLTGTVKTLGLELEQLFLKLGGLNPIKNFLGFGGGNLPTLTDAFNKIGSIGLPSVGEVTTGGLRYASYSDASNTTTYSAPPSSAGGGGSFSFLGSAAPYLGAAAGGAFVGGLIPSVTGKTGPGSTIGGALGGLGGFALGSQIGMIGGPWGAVIGAVLGAVIGGLFGPKPSVGPNSNAALELVNGKLGRTYAAADNGGDAQGIAQLIDQTANSINSMVSRLNGKITNLDAGPGGQLRIEKDAGGYLVGTGNQFVSGDAVANGAQRYTSEQDAVNAFIGQFFEKANITGLSDAAFNVIHLNLGKSVDEINKELDRLDLYNAFITPAENLSAIGQSVKTEGSAYQDAIQFAKDYALSIDQVTAAHVAAIAKLQSGFDTELNTQTNKAFGKDYLNQVGDLSRTHTQNLADARTLGLGDTRDNTINKLFTKQVQNIIDQSQLVGSAFQELIALFPDLTNSVHAFTTAARSAADIMNERTGLETQLLQLQGNTVELRRRERDSLDESNRALFDQIVALQDKQTADAAALADTQRATAAATAAAAAQTQLANSLMSAGGNVRHFLDQFITAPDSGRTAQDRLRLAGAQFTAQYNLAKGNDLDALQNITGYAQKVRDLLIENYGSATPEFTKVNTNLENALGDLPAVKSFDAQQVDLLGTIAANTGNTVVNTGDTGAIVTAQAKFNTVLSALTTDFGFPVLRQIRDLLTFGQFNTAEANGSITARYANDNDTIFEQQRNLLEQLVATGSVSDAIAQTLLQRIAKATEISAQMNVIWLRSQGVDTGISFAAIAAPNLNVATNVAAIIRTGFEGNITGAGELTNYLTKNASPAEQLAVASLFNAFGQSSRNVFPVPSDSASLPVVNAVGDVVSALQMQTALMLQKLDQVIAANTALRAVFNGSGILDRVA